MDVLGDWVQQCIASGPAPRLELQAILERGHELLPSQLRARRVNRSAPGALGLMAATKLASDAAAFVVERVDDDPHASGIRELERSKDRHVSLVDHVTFGVMRCRHLATACAFGTDFISAGFRLLEG